jgi:PAS domain S-box-containing protein
MSVELLPSGQEALRAGGVLPPFSAVMESSSAAIVQLDTEGRVQIWNQSAEKLFGWRSEEVLGKPTPTVPNELWEDNQAWFLRCLGGQTMSGVQMQRRCKDGKSINLHAWAWPVRTEEGHVVGVIKLFFPTGERKQRSVSTENQQLVSQTEQASRFHQALVVLGKTDHDSLDRALQTLCTVASDTLEVDRVSIWLFTDANHSILCHCLYQRSLNHFSSGLELQAKDYPRYFQSLERSRTIAAHAARTDARTSEYTEGYLKPLGITSMLDVPIRLHGKEIGIVCHEHVGTEREWTLEEQAFAGAVADFVSLSFENHQHARAEQALRESEATLYSFVESANACMGIAEAQLDGDLQVLWGNTALQRMWPALCQTGTWGLISSAGVDSKFELLWKSVAQQALYERHPARFEVWDAGKKMWFEVNIAPILLHEREAGRVSFIIEDKTAYRQAITELEKSEQLLEAVIRGSPVGIQVFDKHGILRRQNPAMDVILTRLRRSMLIGEASILRFHDALSAVDTKMAEQALSGEIIENPDHTIELPGSRMGHPSCEAINLDSIYYPVRGLQRDISGIACFHRDISERRQFEDQLQQTQRLESLGLLAGTIAHDFNGLLTAIFGFIDLAKSELSSTHPAFTYLQSSLQAAHRAGDLTQQLLAYAGKGKREMKPFDLSVMVLEVTEILRTLVQQTGTLHMELSPSLPEVTGDLTQIRQVIMNLISNAAEAHSVNKKGLVSVTTGLRRLTLSELQHCQVAAHDVQSGQYVFLEVSDEGSGIPPEIQASLFDPFFTTKSQGRGLGLAAVVGIIRSHRAALQYVTKLGEGTTFTMYLPVS